MGTDASQLSDVVSDPVRRGSVGSPHWSCRSAGRAIAARFVSTKMMCWTQVAVLPQPSVAFQVRSIPGTPVHPALVAASVKLTLTGAPQLSVAVAEPV